MILTCVSSSVPRVHWTGAQSVFQWLSKLSKSWAKGNPPKIAGQALFTLGNLYKLVPFYLLVVQLLQFSGLHFWLAMYLLAGREQLLSAGANSPWSQQVLSQASCPWLGTVK